jgi:hypothetical protein
MFELLSSVTSGDLSLILISGYLVYRLVQTTTEKLNSVYNLTEKFVNNVEVLANNSSVIASSMDSASDNLNSISNAANRFTEVTDTNNWRSTMIELVKLYIPLITQILLPTPTPTPARPIYCDFEERNPFPRCPLGTNFPRSPFGAIGVTGPTGATGPTGPTYPTNTVTPATTGRTGPLDINTINTVGTRHVYDDSDSVDMTNSSEEDDMPSVSKKADTNSVEPTNLLVNNSTDQTDLGRTVYTE